jgi:hypothetical protein
VYVSFQGDQMYLNPYTIRKRAPIQNRVQPLIIEEEEIIPARAGIPQENRAKLFMPSMGFDLLNYYQFEYNFRPGEQLIR